MRKPKLVALVVAFIMTATMSMPTFAFAEDPAEKDLDGEQAGVTRDVQETEKEEVIEENVGTPDQVQEEDLNTITTESGNTETESPASDFKYSVYNNKVTINAYIGTSAEVVIPSAIEGLPVTMIGSGAFSGCSNLSSITIPSSVTSIEFMAFADCSSLSGITIPSSVTSIGDHAFSGCSSLSSITIPSSVTSIGRAAFQGCTDLINITIPEGVESIGDYAFDDCYRLTSVILPEGITSIGSAAFQGCTDLINITIPKSISRIESSTFQSCTDLKSITIPEGVESIGDSAFSCCRSLESIIIPRGVTSIGDSAFEWCSSLNNITIPEGVESIDRYAFRYCYSLKSATIIGRIINIEKMTFCGCDSLTSITIPDSITRIEKEAFEGCDSLKNVYYNSCDREKFNSIVINESGNKNFTDAKVIFKHKTEIEKARPATFTEDGITEGSYCAVCNKVLKEQKTIPYVVNEIKFLENCFFDGNEQKPEIRITDSKGNHLKKGVDYTVEYENNIEVGTADIIVTLCGDKYEGQITGTFNIAKEKPYASISFLEDRIKVRSKKTLSLNVESDSTGKITYKSGNTRYATVSSTGKIKGIRVGTTTVTISVAGDANHKANVKTIEVVVPTVITKAALTKTSYTYDGEMHVPDIKSVNGKTSLIEGEDYTVSRPEGATDAGTYYVTVTATEDGKYDGSYKAKYTIKKASQTISYDMPKLYVNGTEENLNASAPGTGQITYKSSNSKVLKVDSMGNLTGIKSGYAYITMTAPADTNYNKATKKIKVTVYKKDNDITTDIEPAVTTTVGETIDIGAKATGGAITYSSNKRTYASVSSTGIITAKKPGIITITVKAGDSEYSTVTKKITVTVYKKDNTLTTEIEPSVTLTVGETIDIGAKATGGTITYSSNKKTYAPVSSTGTITAKKAGTVTITVKAGDSEYNTVSKKITVKVIK